MISVTCIALSFWSKKLHHLNNSHLVRVSRTDLNSDASFATRHHREAGKYVFYFEKKIFSGFDCKYHYVRRIFVFGQRDKSKVQNTQRQKNNKKTKRQILLDISKKTKIQKDKRHKDKTQKGKKKGQKQKKAKAQIQKDLRGITRMPSASIILAISWFNFSSHNITWGADNIFWISVLLCLGIFLLSHNFTKKNIKMQISRVQNKAINDTRGHCHQ